jgi:outer membrane cobalamin receptor
MKKITVRGLVAVASTLCALNAQAQQLEKIPVTAQKRTESLQDVAVSVAVVSCEDLAAMSKTQIRDLSRLGPEPGRELLCAGPDHAL